MDEIERIFMPAGWEVLDGTIPTSERAEESDIEYVRADILAKVQAELDDARALAAEDHALCRQLQSDVEQATAERDKWSDRALNDAGIILGLKRPTRETQIAFMETAVRNVDFDGPWDDFDLAGGIASAISQIKKEAS